LQWDIYYVKNAVMILKCKSAKTDVNTVNYKKLKA